MKINKLVLLSLISFALFSCVRKHELTDVLLNNSGEDIILIDRSFSSAASTLDNKLIPDGGELVLRYFESRTLDDAYSNCPIAPSTLERRAVQIEDSIIFLTDIPERLEWIRTEDDRHSFGNRQSVKCTCVFK